MGYRLNRLDEPVFMAVSNPLLTEFGIHHRLESCDGIQQYRPLTRFWPPLTRLWHTVLRHIFVHMIFIPSAFEPIYFIFKSYCMGGNFYQKKCRIQWVNLNSLILNFYYYKNCTEIKLSISLCSKKSSPDFCPCMQPHCYPVSTRH